MAHASVLRHHLFFTSLAIAAISPAAASAAQGLFCTRTSQAARIACQNEVRDDFWTTAGICDNFSDPTARKECKSAAEKTSTENSQACGDQFAARQDVCAALGQAPYDPQINPADFVEPADIGFAVPPNPYFPITRGATWAYRSEGQTETVVVTGETKQLLGVNCAVVRDIAKEDGEVIEDTRDFYAQDVNGTVWYFGESTTEFEGGDPVSLAGSFAAGIDGAKPGIIMEAMPQGGDVYRQEFALGEAEDLAEVLKLTGSAHVPGASCEGDCLVTRDFTPLEPGVEEHKYYAPGVGSILEVDLETGERLKLVSFQAH
jgi:hypothetical protein